MAVATVLSIFGWLTLLLNAVTVALIAMLVRRTRPQFKLFGLFESRVRHVAAVAARATRGTLFGLAKNGSKNTPQVDGAAVFASGRGPGVPRTRAVRRVHEYARLLRH